MFTKHPFAVPNQSWFRDPPVAASPSPAKNDGMHEMMDVSVNVTLYQDAVSDWIVPDCQET